MSSSESVMDWATVLSKSKLVDCYGALKFHPDVLGTKKLVKISSEDVSSSTNKWKCALIGQILGDNSSLQQFKKFAEAKWNDSGLVETQKLDNELFIFRFKSEESKIHVLEEESLVFYGSKLMYLRPWTPNKPIQKLTLETVPIWIKLNGLGLQYFTLPALSKLGSLIGRPLFADKDTIEQSRLSYARMCVEIKAFDEKLPNVIVFNDEFGVEIVQDVEYEWVPPRCTFCKLFGHDTNLCTTRNCVPDLGAEADSHDRKSEQPEINAASEEVEQKAASGDEEKSENNKSLLPEKTRISRNKACPCGSKKKYKACCGPVARVSSCEEIGLLPEEKDLEYEWVPARCTWNCVPDLGAEADSHDRKSEQPEINAASEEVEQKSASGDEEKSENNKSLLPEKTRISRNKACPCGSKKKYKACCGPVAGRSSYEEISFLPEEKRISRNKACPCGSKKKYRFCCKSVAGGSSFKDEGESQENLLPEEMKISRNKPCPCGSVKKYKKCCGATCKKKFSKHKGCPCGSTKEYDECCGSIAEDLLPIEDEWIICA